MSDTKTKSTRRPRAESSGPYANFGLQPTKRNLWLVGILAFVASAALETSGWLLALENRFLSQTFDKASSVLMTFFAVLPLFFFLTSWYPRSSGKSKFRISAQQLGVLAIVAACWLICGLTLDKISNWGQVHTIITGQSLIERFIYAPGFAPPAVHEIISICFALVMTIGLVFTTIYLMMLSISQDNNS